MIMDKYGILRDLIQFNTAFDAQNKSIMEYCDAYLTKLGFKTNYVIDNDTHKLCLVAVAGTDAPLGFVCHTDTVVLGNNWKDYDAMDLTIDGDKLVGMAQLYVSQDMLKDFKIEFELTDNSVDMDINFGDYSSHPEFVEVLNRLGISYEEYKAQIARKHRFSTVQFLLGRYDTLKSKLVDVLYKLIGIGAVNLTRLLDRLAS